MFKNVLCCVSCFVGVIFNFLFLIFVYLNGEHWIQNMYASFGYEIAERGTVSGVCCIFSFLCVGLFVFSSYVIIKMMILDKNHRME